MVSGIDCPVRGQQKVCTLMDLMEQGARRHPQKMLATDGVHFLSYGEECRLAHDFAGFLSDRKELGPGSTILIILPNLIEFPAIMAACQSLGIRIGLIPHNAGSESVKGALDLLHPQAVLANEVVHRDRVEDAAPETPVYLLRRNGAGALVTDGGVELAGSRERDHLFRPEGIVCNPEIVLFSSGSSGKPKAIVNRISSFCMNAFKLANALGLVADDVLYLPVPISHVYGFIGIYAALSRGTGIVFPQKYHPASSLDLIAKTRPSVYFGVPTMFIREMELAKKGGCDLSSLRLGMVAGSSCPPRTIRAYQDRFGCRLVQSYGMSETAATVTVGDPSDPSAVRENSVGQSIAGVRIALERFTGEILVETPALMTGMITEHGLEPPAIDDAGWFHTGDIGSIDDKGRLSIVGRIKDVIIRGGVNIFPSEIERVYRAHPDIAECCLVDYPDPELGERTCLCVVLREGSVADCRDIRLFGRGRIERCKLPDSVIVVPCISLLENGKIDRSALRRRVQSREFASLLYR